MVSSLVLGVAQQPGPARAQDPVPQALVCSPAGAADLHAMPRVLCMAYAYKRRRRSTHYRNMAGNAAPHALAMPGKEAAAAVAPLQRLIALLFLKGHIAAAVEWANLGLPCVGGCGWVCLCD